jgi:hypothetical protein
LIENFLATGGSIAKNECEFRIYLLQNVPDFAAYVDDSLYRNLETNEITIDGIISEFSNYFRDNFNKIKEETLKTLFNKIEELFVQKNDLYFPIFNCFLKNIAEKDYHNKIIIYLGSITKDYYNKIDLDIMFR